MRIIIFPQFLQPPPHQIKVLLDPLNLDIFRFLGRVDRVQQRSLDEVVDDSSDRSALNLEVATFWGEITQDLKYLPII